MLLHRKYSIDERLVITIMVLSILTSISGALNYKLAVICVYIPTIYYLYILFLSFTKKGSYLDKDFLFIALLFWTFFMLLRGFKIDFEYIRSLFISQYFFLPYTLPFVAKFFTIASIKKIYSLIHFTNICYLLLVIYLFIIPKIEFNLADQSLVENITHSLLFPNFLLLFSITKLTNKQKIISIITFLVGFYLSIITARRGLVWTFAWAGVLSLLLVYSTIKRSLLNKIIFFISFSILVYLIDYVFTNYEDSLFGNLLSRIDSDTRGDVLDDFNKDMSAYDLTFGRGIGGTYLASEVVDFNAEGQGSNNRNVIEAGYLTIVLGGGYIYLILLLTIYLKAIYNGILKSNNSIAKAFSAFILLHILELYPAGVLWFNMRFLLLWMCIAMCYNKVFLNYTDDNLFLKNNN